ncbi:hypothetical protein [Mumia sp. DW29H23]|uniref:hypothetical protein n=1 Tax=Mumia sp. DW29H23 TaxID=3421241 RepID=UPI003D6868DE
MLTTSPPKVAVSRNAITRIWQITCTACEPGFVALPQPWAFAQDGDTARLVALWHVAEHQRDACGTCGAIPPILKPVVDPDHRNTFRIGDRVFRMTPWGVTELVPAPKEAHDA